MSLLLQRFAKQVGTELDPNPLRDGLRLLPMRLLPSFDTTIARGWNNTNLVYITQECLINSERYCCGR